MSTRIYCAEPCCIRRPTHLVTTRIELQPGQSKDFTDGYCTEHAAEVTEEIAHSNPPNVALVSVIALPPVEPAPRVNASEAAGS